MIKRAEVPTISQHIMTILEITESHFKIEAVLKWDSIPWHIKKIWIENAINQLEILKEIANAEIAMEEKK